MSSTTQTELMIALLSQVGELSSMVQHLTNKVNELNEKIDRLEGKQAPPPEPEPEPEQEPEPEPEPEQPAPILLPNYYNVENKQFIPKYKHSTPRYANPYQRQHRRHYNKYRTYEADTSSGQESPKEKQPIECPVCLEDITTLNAFAPKCRHLICKDCKVSINTCPLCRVPY